MKYVFLLDLMVDYYRIQNDTISHKPKTEYDSIRKRKKHFFNRLKRSLRAYSIFCSLLFRICYHFDLINVTKKIETRHEEGETKRIAEHINIGFIVDNLIRDSMSKLMQDSSIYILFIGSIVSRKNDCRRNSSS